ncbi:MAG: LysE family translocator [Acidobacteriia bacterium]|nr:LysE family translocator [Terriglobia bacterium]
MTELELLLRGLVAGIAIAAPVGPVNVLCISRTIAKGWKAGLISGLGAAAADTFYGSIAGFSITLVIQFLVRELFWIRLCGGILLVTIAVVYYFKPPQHLDGRKRESADTSDFAAALLLNLTNPTTVLSFLAVLAALGMSQHKSWGLTLFLVLGIFGGSMLWWIALTGVVHRLRHRFNDRSMLWMNRIAGLAIGGFGAVTLILALNAR